MPLKDPVARAEYNRRYREAHREAFNAYKGAWLKEHGYYTVQRPPKAVVNARARVARAIARGELRRPSECSECGAGGFIEAAHENYTERLAVRWLCRPCHRKWDGIHPKTTVDGWQKPARQSGTHCAHGHEYTPENSYIHQPTGKRYCRTCARNYRERKKADRLQGPRAWSCSP